MCMLKRCCLSHFLRNSNGRLAFWRPVQKICSLMTALEFKQAYWAARDRCCYKRIVVSGLSARWISTHQRNILPSASELKRLAHISVLVKKFLAFYGTGRSIIVFTLTASCPYLEPHHASLRPPPIEFLKAYFNIILPSTSRSYNSALSLKFPHKNSCMNLSPLPSPIRFTWFARYPSS